MFSVDYVYNLQLQVSATFAVHRVINKSPSDGLHSLI